MQICVVPGIVLAKQQFAVVNSKNAFNLTNAGQKGDAALLQ